jgi:hypothetical protein
MVISRLQMVTCLPVLLAVSTFRISVWLECLKCRALVDQETFHHSLQDTPFRTHLDGPLEMVEVVL